MKPGGAVKDANQVVVKPWGRGIVKDNGALVARKMVLSGHKHVRCVVCISEGIPHELRLQLQPIVASSEQMNGIVVERNY